MISLFETQKEYMARKSAEAEKRARKESTRIRLELASAALKRVEANHLASLKMARAY